MFQMATKYRGRYFKSFPSSTPHQDVMRQTERLGTSVSRLARHHLNASLVQLRILVKELDTALSTQQRKW